MITQPYVNFIQPDAGGNIKPVSKGKIYIGKEGLDQKLGGNPIYYRDNQGVEKEISNPIHLNMTGVAVAGQNDSTIINPYTKKPISILIEDKDGNEVYSKLVDVSTFLSDADIERATNLVFDSISEMKTTSPTEGAKLKTASFYGGWAATINGPSGGKEFFVVNKSEHDTVRGYSTVNELVDCELPNGLIALYIPEQTATPNHFGAMQDGTYDDATAFRACHDVFSNTIELLPANDEPYHFKSQVNVTKGIRANWMHLKRSATDFGHLFRIAGSDGTQITHNDIDNGGVKLTISATSGSVAIVGTTVQDVECSYNKFHNFAGAIDQTKGDEAIIIDQRISFRNSQRKAIVCNYNTVIGAYRNGIAVTAGINIECDWNEFVNCGNSGIDLEPYRDDFVLADSSFSHNRLINCGVNQPTYIGYKAFSLAAVNAHSASGSFFDNVTIEHNYIEVDDALVDGALGTYLLNASGFTNSSISYNRFVVKNRTSGKDTTCQIAALAAGLRGKNNKVSDNYFDTNTVNIYNAERSDIENNTFNKSESIGLSNNERSSISYNDFFDCTCPVPLNSVSGTFNDNTIETTAITPRTFSAIECTQSGVTKKLTARRNRIIGPYDNGFDIESNTAASQEIKLQHNEIRGVFGWGINGKTSYYLEVDDNTFWECGGRTVANGGSGNVNLEFCQRAKVRRNASYRCKGQPIAVNKCDPKPQIIGNEMYDEIDSPQKNSPIFIDRAGSDLAVIKDNIYDVAASVRNIVEVGTTAPNTGIIQQNNVQPS